MFFDRLKIVALAKSMPKRESYLGELALKKILGFLTGETKMKQEEIES